ncbi:hypothetical protein EJ08DRAFT_303714 [Tothia fuscella]|uniref:Uncharacterized protein n=1 Tax=Tothia fuscella TaxID=1048955 RepID=A0A9P4NPC3_9PEZI|nr:hypothetical protein EJ08DRAFT_303714 [Tothia fuscella]
MSAQSPIDIVDSNYPPNANVIISAPTASGSDSPTKSDCIDTSTLQDLTSNAGEELTLQPQEVNGLLRCPREVRDLIYEEYVLLDGEHWASAPYPKPFAIYAFARVHPIIRSELADYYFSHVNSGGIVPWGEVSHSYIRVGKARFDLEGSRLEVWRLVFGLASHPPRAQKRCISRRRQVWRGIRATTCPSRPSRDILILRWSKDALIIINYFFFARIISLFHCPTTTQMHASSTRLFNTGLFVYRTIKFSENQYSRSSL